MSTARNIRLYPWYAALFNALFWYPVFFLYFHSIVSLEQVLQLEAIYYAGVVIAEVPSGYFSDRVGRRLTMLGSAIALTIAYALFFTADGFSQLAVAQLLLACGIAFNSGTDTAFHFDSLTSAGRADEYGIREQLVARRSLLATAIAVLAGGAAGVLDLRWAYGLSFLSALGLLVITWLFREPPHEAERAPSVLLQLRRIGRELRDPTLAWLFAFAVLMTVLIHVPYEFYQPYISLTFDGKIPGFTSDATPLATGVHAALTMFASALVAGRSVTWSERFGLKPVLLSSMLIATFIIGAMGLFLHPLFVVLLILRGLPGALYGAPLKSAVTPRLPRTLRASYLSVQSLAGRLSFSGLLLGLSYIAAGEMKTWSSLSEMLLTATVIAGAAFVVLAASSRLLPPIRRDAE